jgi:quinoprotein glucose dehydrogenase
VKVSDLIDFTPELRRQAIEALKASGLRYGVIYTPGSLVNAADGTRGTIAMPGLGGGSNWWGGSADAETGFVYVSSATNPGVISLERNPNAANPPAPGTFPPPDYRGGRGGQIPTVQGLRITKPPYGRITAYDMNKGEIAYVIANGDTPANVKNNSALKGLTIPKTGSPRQVGILVTKTLLIAGDGTDPALRAYDKRTGADIGQIPLPAMHTALPMTYLHQGRQFILVAVGAANPQGPQLLAFALPQAAGGGGAGRGAAGAPAPAPRGGAPAPAGGAAPAPGRGRGAAGAGARGE